MIGFCATARAAGFVHIVGAGTDKTLDLSALPGKPDVPDTTYGSIATTPGGTPQTVTVTGGYSLGAVLAAAGITRASSFGSAEIAAPQGPPVVLSNLQAMSAFAYTSGGPPVVWDNGSGAQFLVPSTPSGNTNAGEAFAGPGGTVTIELHNGPPLAVGISAAPQPAIIGKPVQLRAYVYGAPSASLQYQWNLGDESATSPEASPTHVYAHIGTYNVYLQASGGADSPGASTVLRVVVGNPPPVISNPGSGSGSGGTGSGTGSGGQGRGSGAGGAQGGATGSHTAAPAAVPQPSTKRVGPRHVKAPPQPVGPLVSGILISDPNQSPAAAARAAAGAARAARVARRQAALAEWMWILTGALALLFVGALFEWNGPRGWFGVPSTR
jgi:PKD repeat protein